MLSSTSPIDRPSLHPGTRYLIAPRVPHGLASVVEGLTREVLRHRPEDIYVFAAHHFEKLLKLREQYYAEEYSGREFDHDFGCDFKLWPTKKAKDIGRSTNSDWSLEKEIEIFERREKVSADVEESTDVSTDRENRKTSKQTCTRSLSTTKKSSKKSKDNETTSDIRATRIISQMSVLPGKNIQTKDIKQELRRNKLSGEKVRATDNTEKGIRNERRSRMRISKTDKDPEEDIERTTTTTSSSRTSARRPLKKVRRIETESETETETISGETMAKTGHENGSSTKNNGANSETIARIENREKRPEAQFSEHSSKRKVSSRALSMDRIRAYVLRKFASSASLEVLRSPTYVEQVQEVIDRAAPIIKEKLEEVRGSRGKRSRSVDLAWNKEFFRQRSRDGKKRDYEKEEESKRKTGNELPERKVDTIKQEETENHLEKDEMISNVETEEKKSRKRSGGSGKKARKRENGGDVGVVDQINGKHSDKLEYESGATHDTLEAKLTATQNILEDISKSTYDLGGARKNDSAGGELPESEISDHANVVSLPIVRPPSSRNSRSATKNGLDNLILPPISPEAPKSTKKKDELSLPVLPVATNGNHSRKSQDAEEASTMHDITNDIEDIAILPEDGHEEVIVDTKQDLDTDLISSTVSDVIDAEKCEKDEDTDDVLLENIPEQFIEKCESLEEYEELERKKMEEIFKDSLNVTPEVVDVPPRPDSLEPDEEKKLQNDDVDLARVNTFDELKDKLIEIEMAERNIEMALAGQQLVMHDAGEETSQAEKSMIDGKINDVGKLADEMEETVSEIEKSADAEKISTNKDDEEKKENDEEEKNTTNEIEKVKDVIEISMNEKENLLNITEKSEDEIKEEIERSSNEMKNTTNEAETSVNEIEKSTNKLNETKILTNEVEVTNQEEILTKAAEEVIKVSEDEKSTDENERSINEKSPTDVEKLTVKIDTEDAQSINLKSQNNDDQTQAAVCETDDDNVTASNNKADNTVNEFSKTIACESAANEREISATNLPDENTAKATKGREKREIDSCPTTSLSLELPFSYVLSEGSPCEIPDSVTTVIIPDRHYSSPATLEDENYQFESTNEKESFIHSNIAKKSETQENKNGMEIFGEYIQPEVDILPDIDFVHSTRGVKSSQIIIAHQDLDNIKEEGEEEEKKDVEKEEIETPREQKDDTQPIIHEEETKPVILEGITEHEENEETSMKMTSEFKDAEEISCKISKYESSPDTVELMADTGLIDEENMNLVVESRDTIENSSEENGSTQDTHTITSSDVKESTVSNQSIESPSLDRPIVPELNLDSLQDNTVSSFKMTANGTVTKENNDSPRESDTTTSLIEPLISDERLMNQPNLADREEDIAAEELTESLRSEVPEADQLYQAEHAEYEWLEKDPSSLEINLEDEVKSPENSIGLKALPEDVVVVGPLLRDEEMEKKIDSEEEIARELIGSLEEDMQLYVKALEEKSKENGESEKNSLNMNDKSNQSLLESVDEQEKGEHEISSEEIQTLDKIARTETINELSSQMGDIKQDSEDKNVVIDSETEELKLQVEEKDGIEIARVAPLAQFEQELLELNDTQIKTDEEKITVENKLDTDTVSTDNQENLENSQTNIEEVIESQSNENINKIEELHEQQEKSEEEVQDKEECEPEKLEVEEEQEKLERDKEYQQEKSEKCTQEDLKIQETDNHENLQLEENIVDVKTMPLEATESRKGSINESTNNDEGETEPITCDEFIIDDETEKETKNNEIEKSEDLSAKIQNIHEPISEQSTEDHFHGGYWITETKSSTVETVIGTSTSNEGMEPNADVSEIIQDESLSQKKDDFHSAVVKIQACLRGFLMRRRMKEDASSKSISNNISSAQKIDIDDHLTVPHSSSSREVKTGRQRLRREEALRNTTLSLENAFATGRLQHTGEFHDSVPLALFDPIYRKDNSTTSDEFLNKAIEEDAEQTNQSDIAKSSDNENNSVHDDKHGGSFQKGNIFTDHSTIPIVMHLLADASRNCHFTVSQNSHPDFNTNAGGAKPAEPTLTDILMLGYPRDDENRYLNFITSVEDLGCNMDSLSLNDTIKCSKNTDDAHPSTTSGEGSIREPLALPGSPQGVVIEEVTSLETELVPSESATKPSTTSKTSLDTNSSVSSEECTLEDEKNDLGTSPRIVDAMEDRKHVDGETERQKSDCKHLESISEDDSHSEDAKKESSEVSCDNHERVEEEKNEKT